jgi:hypothetical protein
MSSRGTVTTRALPGSPFNQPPAVAIVARIGYWLIILIGTVEWDAEMRLARGRYTQTGLRPGLVK